MDTDKNMKNGNAGGQKEVLDSAVVIDPEVASAVLKDVPDSNLSDSVSEGKVEHNCILSSNSDQSSERGTTLQVEQASEDVNSEQSEKDNCEQSGGNDELYAPENKSVPIEDILKTDEVVLEGTVKLEGETATGVQGISVEKIEGKDELALTVADDVNKVVEVFLEGSKAQEELDMGKMIPVKKIATSTDEIGITGDKVEGKNEMECNTTPIKATEVNQDVTSTSEQTVDTEMSNGSEIVQQSGSGSSGAETAEGQPPVKKSRGAPKMPKNPPKPLPKETPTRQMPSRRAKRHSN